MSEVYELDQVIRRNAACEKQYDQLGARFPDYGYYASVDPRLVLEEKPSVGDAIDDLADIVLDLREVSWRYDTFGADDAHWHFRFLFQIHWGAHVRDLSRYLEKIR